MSSFQQTVIIGNLGRDPELRYTQNGTPVCSFSVAVSEEWTDKKTNEKREKTTWFRVSAWGNLGENCHKYLTKGRQVMVRGSIEASAYINNAGEASASLELKAVEVVFLGQKGESSSEGQPPADNPGNYAPPPEDVGDIPF